MKLLRAVALGCVSSVVAGTAMAMGPLHKWDFERVEGGCHAVDTGTSKMPRSLRVNAMRAGQGVRGSAGVWVDCDHTVQATDLLLEDASLTVDLSFRLDGEFDVREGHALWSYAWHSWRRGRILARLTKERRIEVSFIRAAAKDGSVTAVDFQAVSRPLDVCAGRFHSVRVSSSADGWLTAYFDGVLVLKKDGCPGVQGIRTASPVGYPFFRIGQDDDQLDRPRSFLNGVVDDVAIYGEALGAPQIEVGSDVAGDDTAADDVLVLAGGKGQTGLFSIKDKKGTGLDGYLLGESVRAPEKFQKCRSRAVVAIDDDFIRITVPCPVPEGETVKRNPNTVWSGDAVEVFLRPDPEKPVYFHYAVNAAGLTAAGKYANGQPVSSWTSAATGACEDDEQGFVVSFRIPRSEVFATMPQEGDVFAAQFIRTGPTTFGVASWKPAGAAFHDPSTFGRVVYGACGAYFGRRVAEARSQAARQFKTEEARAAAEKAVASFESAVAKHGADARAFGSLEAMFGNLMQEFLQIAMSGKRLLVYRPQDIWGNDQTPDSLTQPLDRIAIRAARGERAFFPFAVANLSDRPYLGQVKVFDNEPKPRFSLSNRTGISRRFAVRESLSIQTGAGKALLDPVAPLPMETVLRIAPHMQAPMWLELDTQGLAAGRYTAMLYLKRGYAGFETERIPIDVEIIDVDLDEVRADRACYTALPRPSMGRRFAEFLVKHDFNMIYAGVPNGRSLPLYSRFDRDGRIVLGNMAPLDAIIDAHLAAGMKRERLGLWFFLALENGFGPDGEVLGERWMQAFKSSLEHLYSHVEAKYGIRADRIVLYPVDEPSGDVEDPKTKMGKAYRFGKAIRSLGERYRLLVNPLPGIPEPEWRKAMVRLAECYDIVEFYRPGLTPAQIAFARTLPFREFWTYSILGKETHPAPYRADYWANLRDGFREIATFWHLDEMAGGDGFDSMDAYAGSQSYVDYGSVYADWDLDTVLSSRRQIAADIGFEEARLILWLREKAKGSESLSAQIESIVKTAADVGTMAAMDAARESLLSLAAAIQRRLGK